MPQKLSWKCIFWWSWHSQMMLKVAIYIAACRVRPGELSWFNLTFETLPASRPWHYRYFTGLIKKPMERSLVPSGKIHLSGVSESHKRCETWPLSKHLWDMAPHILLFFAFKTTLFSISPKSFCCKSRTTLLPYSSSTALSIYTSSLFGTKGKFLGAASHSELPTPCCCF